MSRKTVARTTVSVVVTIAPLIIIMFVQNPDLAVRCKMRGALLVKRYADAKSWQWGQVSARAATVYHRTRL